MFKAVRAKSKELIGRYMTAEVAASATATASVASATYVMTKLERPFVSVVQQYLAQANNQPVFKLPPQYVNYTPGPHNELAYIIPIALSTGLYIYFTSKKHFEKYLR